MIVIADYGVGNLFSLVSSFRALGEDISVATAAQDIEKADKIILPGVGAFGDAANKLSKTGIGSIICKKASDGVPVLGICLGMQLLFEKSYEYGQHSGLGLLKGEVVPMEGKVPPELKIPHIGWNALRFTKRSPLFKYINEGDCVYFVHSYYAADCYDSVIAQAEYGIDVTAAVQKGNIFGCQFHPEKSGGVGLNILKAFCRYQEDTD